ncbi:uncharacterized protein FOMMEDRAFT_44419, partial [Fomitiporia mediterranea MF3/22]|uniref:uncharacterized protein n=1 Tax=Fomitiporia mediterranea (strain MF3/22) TaxID=694068 RepID=UPI0004408842
SKTASRPAINTGSAKLFVDAFLEESSFSNSNTSERVARLVKSHTQEVNWDGEERIQDAVLRMLVDKYKPLRGPTVKNADEKLKERPPVVQSSPPSTFAPVYEDEGDPSISQTASISSVEYHPNWQTRASEPLLPAVEGHRPWHTTFTPPSSARIKTGTFAPSSARRSTLSLDGDEPIKQDISAARRNANAQRLGRARESTLDYRLGLARQGSREGHGHGHGQGRRHMPVGMKAWASLVEERIERARLQGQFKTIKGRGKPLEREMEERNPFIAREEFLMNRIVQRNQAAPPWVELQAEVETAIQTFRTLLQQTWTRRLILHLTSRLPLSRLSSLTLEDIRSIRDTNWVNRESNYHASALGEVNEVVRRYNGVAPYSVRKPYFVKEAELERVYWACAEDVLEGV